MAFAANRLLHADIFQHNRKGEFVPDFNHSILFSGQTFARLKHVNVSLDDELLNSLRSHVTSDLSGFTLLSAAFYKQVSAYDYGMAMLSSTSDQTLNDYVLEAEIGLYDHAIDQFLERYWREISGGDLIAVSASVKTDKHAASTIGSDEIEMSNIQDQQQPQLQQHEMTFTRDFMGRVSALSHTWRSEDSTNGNSQNGQQCEASGFVSDGVPLRVMTYNLWHNNPPSWVYRDQRYSPHCFKLPSRHSGYRPTDYSALVTQCSLEAIRAAPEAFRRGGRCRGPRCDHVAGGAT